MPEDRQRQEHPSFGFIRASRVSGSRTLFDSALKHQHYIEIEIGSAYTTRDYNQNNVSANGMLPHITVDMSESQFAQFITSMNTASGAPCTLTYLNGEHLPDPPAERNTKERFEEEVEAQAAEILENVSGQLETINDLLVSGKTTKANLQALRKEMFRLRQDLEANMPFMLAQFASSVEKITDRARMDLNAHALMVGLRLGQDGAPALIESEKAEEDGFRTGQSVRVTALTEYDGTTFYDVGDEGTIIRLGPDDELADDSDGCWIDFVGQGERKSGDGRWWVPYENLEVV